MCTVFSSSPLSSPCNIGMFRSSRCLQQPRAGSLFLALLLLLLLFAVSLSPVRKGIAGHYSSPTSVAVALLCMVPVLVLRLFVMSGGL